MLLRSYQSIDDFPGKFYREASAFFQVITVFERGCRTSRATGHCNLDHCGCGKAFLVLMYEDKVRVMSVDGKEV